jgi:hypothetical protein
VRWSLAYLETAVYVEPARADATLEAVLTAFGVTALTFMMVMYALERRHAGFVLAFAVGCVLASVYGFLSGAWVFGIVEAIWCLVAIRRFAISPSSQPRGQGSVPAQRPAGRERARDA